MQLDEPHNANFMAKSATRMAILGVPLSLLVNISLIFLPVSFFLIYGSSLWRKYFVNQGQPSMNFASSSSKGDTLVALGSPFGILSPVNFFNRWIMATLALLYFNRLEVIMISFLLIVSAFNSGNLNWFETAYQLVPLRIAILLDP